MSRLKSLTVSGWKSIKETDPPLEFGPINVLIGANGSGKSNLISFCKLLNELLAERLQTFVVRSGGAESLLHYGSKKTLSVVGDLELETGNNTSRYFIQLTHAAVDTLIISEERVELHGPDNP